MRTQLWRVRTGATSSFALRVREHATTKELKLPDHIERTLPLIEALTMQIRVADKELQTIAKNDPIGRRLMTVPGVGPVTAIRFLAAIDDVTRFRNAHAVQSYIGLTPGEYSSSDSKHRTRITKAGSSKLRRALVQAAWCCMRTSSEDSMIVWARKLAERKHKFLAVVALARRLAGILFAIWRDGSMYRARPPTAN